MKPSKSRLAARLSTEVENMAGFAFGEKSLLNYYNTAVSSKHQELRIPQIEVIDALVQYSGFSSYSAFIAEQEPINETRYMLPRKGRLVFKLGRLKIESIWFFKLSI